jgi:putative oxidoreductase
MDASFYNAWTPRALALMRIVVGYLYIMHGISKFFGFPQAFPRPVELFSLIGLAGALELVGGALVIIGLFTRLAAFLLSGEMAFAYFMGHAFSKGSPLFPMTNGGELAVLYCFVFLFLAVAGGGAWSVDALRDRARAPTPG